MKLESVPVICETYWVDWLTINSPCERRFDALLDGPTILGGAPICYHPIFKKTTIEYFNSVFTFSLLSSSDTPYAVRRWTGDLLVADCDELEENVASRVHVKISRQK